MISQLAGAVLRAFITLIVIATPALMIPGTTTEGAQMVMLVGLTLSVFIGVEYAAVFPGLVEFRDAPPFNRVRILSLFLSLFLLSIVVTAEQGQSSLALIVNAFGLMISRALDFPFSPMNLIIEQLPEGIDPFLLDKIRGMAGISLLVAVVSMIVFALLVRLHQWPARGFAFNVWVNLPTFDPTTGGDIIKRLRRDSRVNLILGFCTPFLLPVVAVLAANHIDAAVLSSPHTLVWGLTLWTFIPLSMLMRGLAMGRIADMIAQRRARLTAAIGADAPKSVAMPG